MAAATGFGLLAAPLALATTASADLPKGSTAASAKAKPKPPVKLDLYAINDFHGQLEVIPPDTRPGRQSGGEVLDKTTEVNAGGAAYLATHLDTWRAASEARGAKAITVAAGDLIGATPLLSAAFHDEPSIEAMNAAGLDISSVGNHEFDEGYQELLRLQSGECLDDGPDGADNQNSCPDPDHPFEGAQFDYLAANVKDAKGKTILPPYSVRGVGGQRVAFIGMTLENTPNIVTKAGIEGLSFTDEVETVNALVPEIRAKGIRSIVVLLHEGIAASPITDISGCSNPVGPGLDIARNLDPEVDLIVSGHTHQPYICEVLDPNGQRRLITSAYSVGRVVTEINLEIDRTSGDVIRDSVLARNRIVTNSDGTAADPDVLSLIDRYSALVAPIASRVLGQVAPAESRNSVTRTVDLNGRDSELGNLIADAQVSDPTTVPPGGRAPVVALMNPGGIRADLAENAENNVTYAAAFSVQPFNNYVVSMDLTGQQVLDVLNQQWNGLNESTNPSSYKVLQAAGLKYTWDLSDAAQVGASAIVGDVLIDANGDGVVAEVLDPAATYRVVVNSFLSDGGDGFPTLAQGTSKYFGGLDIDGLARYLAANNPYVPTPTDRISNQP